MNIMVFLFLATFIVWELLNWVPEEKDIVAGFFISFFISVISGVFFKQKKSGSDIHKKYFYFIFYFVPLFLFETLKGSLAVAGKVISPYFKDKSAIIKIKTELKSDMGLLFLACSITMAKGALCVDADKEQGILIINISYLNEEHMEKMTKKTVSAAVRFEKILKLVFE